MKSKILSSLIATGALGDAVFITALISEGYVSEQTAIEMAEKSGKFDVKQYVRELQAQLADRVKYADLYDRASVDSLKTDFSATIAEIRDLLPSAVQTEIEDQYEPVILG